MTAQPATMSAIPFALIQRAVAHIRHNDLGAAEKVLRELLASRPDDAKALAVLGFVRYRQGHLEDAARILAASCDRQPSDADVRINLGYVMRDLGRVEDAEKAFGAAIALKPDQPEPYFVLAGLLHKAGKFEEAEQYYRAVLTLLPSHGEAKLGLSALLIEIGKFPEAEAVIRSALSETDDKALIASLEQNLGLVTGKQNRFEEAFAAYARAQEADPRLAHLAHRRACLLAEADRFDEAITLFEDALARDPANLSIHKDYNDLLFRLGRDDKFLRSYEGGAGVTNATPFLLAKASFLLAAGRAEEAHEVYERARRRDPDGREAKLGEAVALSRLAKFEPALEAFEALIRDRPQDISPYGEAAAVLLRMHEPLRAMATAMRGLEIVPFDQSCLAHLGTAYRMLGDARDEVHNGFDRLIRSYDLDPPDGYADMASFNRDLDAYLDSLHKPLREFAGQSLRRGSQTTNHIFGSGHELVGKLRARLDDALRRYIGELRADENRAFAARNSRTVSYSGSWSSRLRDCGFHVNHIHTGWISSCYYVALPDEVNDRQARQGWIKFGEPPYDIGLREPVARAIQPHAGMLVLFPSYIWHGTIPFHSTTERTTIAFDVVPT